MHDCPACARARAAQGLCGECARARGTEDAMGRAAAWAISALHRHDRHPGFAPFLLWDGGTVPGVQRVPQGGVEGVARGHDGVRDLEPLHAFAYVAPGWVRTRDFSFDPGFSERPGARGATIVVSGVAGHPLALVVGRPHGASAPSFFQQVPNWLGKGERKERSEPVGGLAVGVRLKE